MIPLAVNTDEIFGTHRMKFSVHTGSADETRNVIESRPLGDYGARAKSKIRALAACQHG